ncbi:hypothetical protein FISHEDRAFT_70219 [Fistulina hepatica ATCC 64428]|uniref:DH domain-containing protein n=1 Tax=Fistulina hepatica ATCC 64428 TaxID=1128425 RepID=A0A0D7AK64_9AGAR|nr:hypothetical protein FISHEDRAFT_70219 [Fistulina hepatica ATCC 64428]
MRRSSTDSQQLFPRMAHERSPIDATFQKMPQEIYLANAVLQPRQVGRVQFADSTVSLASFAGRCSHHDAEVRSSLSDDGHQVYPHLPNELQANAPASSTLFPTLPSWPYNSHPFVSSPGDSSASADSHESSSYEQHYHQQHWQHDDMRLFESWRSRSRASNGTSAESDSRYSTLLGLRRGPAIDGTGATGHRRTATTRSRSSLAGLLSGKLSSASMTTPSRCGSMRGNEAAYVPPPSSFHRSMNKLRKPNPYADPAVAVAGRRAPVPDRPRSLTGKKGFSKSVDTFPAATVTRLSAADFSSAVALSPPTSVHGGDAAREPSSVDASQTSHLDLANMSSTDLARHLSLSQSMPHLKDIPQTRIKFSKKQETSQRTLVVVSPSVPGATYAPRAFPSRARTLSAAPPAIDNSLTPSVTTTVAPSKVCSQSASVKRAFTVATAHDRVSTGAVPSRKRSILDIFFRRGGKEHRQDDQDVQDGHMEGNGSEQDDDHDVHRGVRVKPVPRVRTRGSALDGATGLEAPADASALLSSTAMVDPSILSEQQQKMEVASQYPRASTTATEMVVSVSPTTSSPISPLSPATVCLDDDDLPPARPRPPRPNRYYNSRTPYDPSAPERHSAGTSLYRHQLTSLCELTGNSYYLVPRPRSEELSRLSTNLSHTSLVRVGSDNAHAPNGLHRHTFGGSSSSGASTPILSRANSEVHVAPQCAVSSEQRRGVEHSEGNCEVSETDTGQTIAGGRGVDLTHVLSSRSVVTPEVLSGSHAFAWLSDDPRTPKILPHSRPLSLHLQMTAALQSRDRASSDVSFNGHRAASDALGAAQRDAWSADQSDYRNEKSENDLLAAPSAPNDLSKMHRSELTSQIVQSTLKRRPPALSMSSVNDILPRTSAPGAFSRSASASTVSTLPNMATNFPMTPGALFPPGKTLSRQKSLVSTIGERPETEDEIHSRPLPEPPARSKSAVRDEDISMPTKRLTVRRRHIQNECFVAGDGHGCGYTPLASTFSDDDDGYNDQREDVPRKKFTLDDDDDRDGWDTAIIPSCSPFEPNYALTFVALPDRDMDLPPIPIDIIRNASLESAQSQSIDVVASSSLPTQPQPSVDHCRLSLGGSLPVPPASAASGFPTSSKTTCPNDRDSSTNMSTPSPYVESPSASDQSHSAPSRSTSHDHHHRQHSLWSRSQHVTAEFLDTEKHYLALLRLLLRPRCTQTPPPPLMRAYVQEIVAVSEGMIKIMDIPYTVAEQRVVSVEIVCAAFIAMQDSVEGAYTRWCGAVGTWFTGREPRPTRRLSKVLTPARASSEKELIRRVRLSLGKDSKQSEDNGDRVIVEEHDVPSSESSSAGHGHGHKSSCRRNMSSQLTPQRSSHSVQDDKRRNPTVRELAILPTQRVMRYVLLYRDLLANTPDSSPARPLVQQAVDISSRIAAKCDRAQENAVFFLRGR